MGVSISSRGRNSADCLLIPPPTTISSGRTGFPAPGSTSSGALPTRRQDRSWSSRTEFAAHFSATRPSISRWPSSELGSNSPSYRKAEPIPVPSVVMMTSPFCPRAAPKLTSASPAASASLTTCTSRWSDPVKRASASVPIQDLSMLAAECTTPLRTTPGTVTPIGTVESGNLDTSSANTSATASGVDCAGVLIRTRSAANSPWSRSTGAPLIPLPPKSIPKPWFMAAIRPQRAETMRRTRIRENSAAVRLQT